MDLRERYEKLPDEDLLAIVVDTPGDYTEEAIALASTVLAARGVDVERFRGHRDAEAEERRERVRDEAQRAQEAREEVIAEGRIGVCLACRDRAPEIERRVTAVRASGETKIRNVTIESHATIDLAIPLCSTCDARLRPPAWIPTGWLLLAWAVAAIALGIAAVYGAERVFAGALDTRWMLMGGMGLTAAAIWVPISARRLAARRLGRQHPSADRLTAAGFHFVPADEAGHKPLDVYADLLVAHDPMKRKLGEHRLGELPGPETVARMRGLLDHPIAGEHAIRVLVALRAKEALPDLDRLARGPEGAIRDAARGALRAFGRDPDAS